MVCRSLYPCVMRALFLLVIVLFTAPAIAADFPARVIGISDGDTITVLKSDKTQVRIRLYGIDAPESGQDFGSRAKQETSDLAFRKQVTVRPHDIDKYGRTVAEVILPGGVSLNRELVSRGMAWWYVKYAPTDQVLAQLQAEAKAAKRGLWSQDNPIPPWDLRHRQGDTKAAGVIGNSKSRVYHRPTCRGAVVMKEANRVNFATAQDAEVAGYRSAGDCK